MDKGYKEKVHEQVKNKKCQYICKNLKSSTSTVTTAVRKQHLLRWQELKKKIKLAKLFKKQQSSFW